MTKEVHYFYISIKSAKEFSQDPAVNDKRQRQLLYIMIKAYAHYTWALPCREKVCESKH